MPPRRPRRVGELIRQELAFLLAAKLRDPRLKGAALTEVEVARDLKTAHVFFVCPPGRSEAVAAGLRQAGGFIKRELAAKLELRYMPDLVYHYDTSLDKGRAMEDLLASLKEGE